MEFGLCMFASRFDREGGDPRRVQGLGWSSAREASSQVKDDPNWWGSLAFVSVYL